MKIQENNKIGFYIVFINIIITLFLLSSEGDKNLFFITSIVSNIVAIIFNMIVLIKANKRVFNIISLVLNIMILGIIIFIYVKK